MLWFLPRLYSYPVNCIMCVAYRRWALILAHIPIPLNGKALLKEDVE